MKIKAHASLTDKAYQTLVHRIVTLDLAPGSVLTESHLMQEMKIGRTPIREAIQRLIAEGLVTHLHHRGMLVADIRDSKANPKLAGTGAILAGLLRAVVLPPSQILRIRSG